MAQWALSLAFALAAAPIAWTGPQSATAKADKTQVRLGEPFTLTITVKHAPGELWTFAQKQSLGPFAKLPPAAKAKGAVGLPARLASGPGVSRLTLRLALFALGPEAVPSLALVATDARGVAHPFSLPGPTVKGVAPELAKDHERRDIRPPVPVFVPSLRILWLALGILAALGLVLAAVAGWRRRPRAAQKAPTAPMRPADEVALLSLEGLEAEGLPGQGRFKEFHLRLSLALRGYLEARYGLNALDLTSTELLSRVERLPTEGLRLNDLAWICAQGDEAKFAKGQPSPDDCKQALGLVRQLVLRTRAAAPTVAFAAQPTAAAPRGRAA